MAMNSSFARFYADGLMHAPAALQSAMQAELFACLRDFCQFTNVWQEDVSVNVSSASLIYTLTLTEGKATHRLLNLYDGTDIDKRWVWPATMPTPGVLRLSRAITGSATLAWTATLGIYPLDPIDSDGNPVFPSWILDKYFDALFSGMLARMMAQPGKPWSNTRVASFHYRKYMGGRGLCAAEVQRANTQNAQAWSYPTGNAVYGRQKGV